MTVIALTIAGSDSGGGAGIQADLKTFSALGAYGASVVTALTAQNTQGVQGVLDIPPDFIRAQMDSVLGDLAVGAVKIGMLSQPGAIEAVAAGLRRHEVRNVVLDPVMVATSGDRLISDSAIATLRETLLPLASVVTPNLPEAGALLDEPTPFSEADMLRQGRRILALGCSAVLMKGGHGGGGESTDILVTPAGEMRLTAPRRATRNTHGTGCTLSAAIAARLAAGLALADAVREAKSYVTASIEAADRLAVGSGSGPVHHFHRWW